MDSDVSTAVGADINPAKIDSTGSEATTDSASQPNNNKGISSSAKMHSSLSGGPSTTQVVTSAVTGMTNNNTANAATKAPSTTQRATSETHDPESTIWYIYGPHWKTISATQIESIQDTWIKRTVDSMQLDC